MRVMQRALLVIAVIGMFGLGVMIPVSESAVKMQNQWELLHTERFIEQICRSKECSYEEYLLYHTALNYSGTSSVIELEEYQKEQDMAGSEYYYGISWDEIQERLFTEGQYRFSDGSVVVICVSRHSNIGKYKNQYYNIVSGKD